MSAKERTLAGLWVILIIAPLLAADCTQNFVKDDGEASKNNSNQPWPSYEYATLAVLMLQAWIYWRQSRLMGDQAKISARQVDTIERLERPLVLPIAPLGEIGYRDSLDKSTFPVVDIDFQNYGRSPALVDCWHIAFAVGLNEPDRQPLGDRHFHTFTKGTSYETKDATGQVTHYTGASSTPYIRIESLRPSIAPDDRLGAVDLSGPKLNVQQVSDIAIGVQAVWLDAVFFYENVWGKRHETCLRWKYDPRLDIFMRNGKPGSNGYT